MPGLRDNPIGRSTQIANASLAQAYRSLTEAKEDALAADVAKIQQAVQAKLKPAPAMVPTAQPTRQPRRTPPNPNP